MIEYSPHHIALLFGDFHDDALEHYLSPEEYNEYYDSDFRNTDTALYWLERLVGSIETYNAEYRGYNLYKESLRQIITSNGVIPINACFPGIDDVDTVNIDIEKWYIECYYLFLFVLWDYLFNEEYQPADLSEYRERIDYEFVHFPRKPELWKEEKYKDGV